ncbi:hypothetical protein MD535_03085 [Vibrio sp. ZSDZ65]|uniref:Uncharacterized protein n=1 Tax=Vibrio qingdaonensis TaxID=2829491 RepID=A0A9X3CKB5_9VIBR|nr:hypothetical protein [Vibrio qingdaonensis]MCW8345013.1 hypothetical protein [Vibrio qingdaonensis]
MVSSILTLLAPSITVTLLILTLILAKGDICPGQRGRIHKLLPAIGLLWLAIASIKIEAFLVVFAIFYFYSKVKTGKTRDKGPFWVIHLANGFGLAFSGILISSQATLGQGAALLSSGLLLGSAFAHLLLIIARSRLQAFHRILPMFGVILTMVFVLIFLINAYHWPEDIAQRYLVELLMSFLMLLIGIVFWIWHLVRHTAPEKRQLSIAFFCLLSACVGLFNLYAFM